MHWYLQNNIFTNKLTAISFADIYICYVKLSALIYLPHPLIYYHYNYPFIKDSSNNNPDSVLIPIRKL